MLEEEIQKLEKMNDLDYLSVLNEEEKGKLIFFVWIVIY